MHKREGIIHYKWEAALLLKIKKKKKKEPVFLERYTSQFCNRKLQNVAQFFEPLVLNIPLLQMFCWRLRKTGYKCICLIRIFHSKNPCIHTRIFSYKCFRSIHLQGVKSQIYKSIGVFRSLRQHSAIIYLIQEPVFPNHLVFKQNLLNNKLF